MKNLSRTRRLFGFFCGWMCALLIALAIVFAPAWWPTGPIDVPGFGATIQQCEATFGKISVNADDPANFHRKSFMYVKRGWFITVSFDETNHAEQYVFSKSSFPFVQAAALNDSEQKTLLDKFKEGSTWNSSGSIDVGPMWERSDGQAFAGYAVNKRSLVLMNEKGTERPVPHPSQK